MGTSQTMPPREPARLYLVTPPIGDAGAVADGLADALNAADIAAVLVRLSAGDERTQIERVKALRILIQSNGAALLLDGRPDLVEPILEQTGDMGGIARRGDRHHGAGFRHLSRGGEHGGATEAVADEDRRRVPRAPQLVCGRD